MEIVGFEIAVSHHDDCSAEFVFERCLGGSEHFILRGKAVRDREVITYASSMEEVQRDMVIGDTPYFSKDMSVVWIKNAKGDIKTYELTEIVPKDNKDLQIEYLQAQIKELRKEMEKYESDDDIDEPTSKSIKSEESSNVSTISKSSKKSK